MMSIVLFVCVFISVSFLAFLVKFVRKICNNDFLAKITQIVKKKVKMFFWRSLLAIFHYKIKSQIDNNGIYWKKYGVVFIFFVSRLS